MKIGSTDSGLVHAIVPLKALKESKTRLSPILRPTERAELTIAMLADVLSALKKSKKISSITVVSADKTALKTTRLLGADPVWERKSCGLNRAICFAIRKRNLASSSVLAIHADLPLLTAHEVDRFLRGARGYPIALAPSKDQSGTNALLLNPASLVRPAFGKGSFKRHLSIAKQRRLRCKVRRAKGLGFDVDEPKDLVELMHNKSQSNAARFLRTVTGRSLDCHKATY